MSDWLTVTRGDAPLIVALPHTGIEIPAPFDAGLVSLERARHDADWHVEKLYAFAAGMGVTLVRTAVSRTVIDVNRDPSGASLYPGMVTTGLCPTETFDGLDLYREGQAPDATSIARRLETFFTPYHDAVAAEIDRLRMRHARVVLYDAHSILSRSPRLFEGELPQFNIGTNDGASCAPALADAVAHVCAESGRSHVVNGRFKGGWTTRHYGAPARGVHAIQMELAMRGYLDESAPWPPVWDSERAAPLIAQLGRVLEACLFFAAEAS